MADVSDRATESCPWCYTPPESFENGPTGVSCPTCSAVIPVDAAWYQDGEKVASPQWASFMGFVDSD